MMKEFRAIGYEDDFKTIKDKKHLPEWTPLKQIIFEDVDKLSNKFSCIGDIKNGELRTIGFEFDKDNLNNYLQPKYFGKHDILYQEQIIDKPKNAEEIFNAYKNQKDLFGFAFFETPAGEIIYGTTNEIAKNVRNLLPEIQKKISKLKTDFSKYIAKGYFFRAIDAPLSNDWNAHENLVNTSLLDTSFLFTKEWVLQNTSVFESQEQQDEFLRSISYGYDYRNNYNIFFNNTEARPIILAPFDENPANIIPFEKQRAFMNKYQYLAAKSYINYQRRIFDEGEQNKEKILNEVLEEQSLKGKEMIQSWDK